MYIECNSGMTGTPYVHAVGCCDNPLVVQDTSTTHVTIAQQDYADVPGPGMGHGFRATRMFRDLWRNVRVSTRIGSCKRNNGTVKMKQLVHFTSTHTH